MRLFLLALRNLTRNKRRTMITAGAVVFGAMAIVFLQGFVNGFIRLGIEASVLTKVAPIQVYRKGYIGADDPLKLNLPTDPALVAKIAAVPGVNAVAPRIFFDGMVSNGAESTMFMATAIDPALEYKVCPMRKTQVARGSAPLAPGHDGSVLIGKTLAEALGAKLGSTLVMQSAGPNAAGTNAIDIEVSGFLPTLNIIESKRMATVSLGFAQQLLRMDGQVTQYAVGVGDLAQVDAISAAVRAALGPEFLVTTWREIDPRTAEQSTTLRWVLGFVGLVLFLLVATGIINTMLMSVHERVREIGTMLAVGVRRWQIMTLFLWEAVALGILGAAVGVAGGYAIVRAFERAGVKLNPPGGDMIVYVHPHIDFWFLGAVVVFAVIGTVLAALYPAWKASRLQPVEALRAT